MGKLKTINKISNEVDPLEGDLSEVLKETDWKEFSEYFHFAKKNKTLTLRVSDELLKKFKFLAKKKDTKYQKLVYEALVQYVIREKAS